MYQLLDRTMKYFASIIFFLTFSQVILSQDIHFSNISNSPLFYNIAFTGYANYNRLAALHRNQWKYPTSSEPYKTYSLWGDYKLPSCNNHNSKLIDQDWIGISGQFVHDAAGDFNLSTQSENIGIAYHFGFKNAILSFGTGGGVNRKYIDGNSLYFENQWNGYSFNPNLPNYENNLKETFPRYYNMMFGSILTIQPVNKNYRINMGIAINNLVFQDVSLYENGNNKLSSKINLHAGYFGKMKFGYIESFFTYSLQNTSYESILGMKLHGIFYRNLNLGFYSRIGGISDFDKIQRDFLIEIGLVQNVRSKDYDNKTGIIIEYSFCTDINTISNVYNSKPSKLIASPELCVKAYFNSCNNSYFEKAPYRIESGRGGKNIKDRTPIKPKELFYNICERMGKKEKFRLKGKTSFNIGGGFAKSLSNNNFVISDFSANTGYSYYLNIGYLKYFNNIFGLGFEINPGKHENSLFIPVNIRSQLNVSLGYYSIYLSPAIGYSLEFHSSYPNVMFKEKGGIFARAGLGIVKYMPNDNMSFNLEIGYQHQKYLLEYMQTDNISSITHEKIFGEIPMVYAKLELSFYFRKRH